MSERRTIALIFLTALTACALLTKASALSWNDASRWATVDALSRSHTFAIERSRFWRDDNGDTIRRGAHVYSDKPPAVALQGAAFAAALRPLAITLDATPGTAIVLITIGTVGVWFAVGCAYAYLFARRVGMTRHAAAFVAAVTGGGTLALPYAVVLSNHVPAGAAAIAAAYHLDRARQSVRDAVLGGTLLALAIAYDFAAGALVASAAIFLYRAPLTHVAAAACAALPFAAAQFAFNLWLMGAAGPVALNPSSYPDGTPFHRSAWLAAPFSSAGDFARYALSVVAGGKGLFVYTPAIALCLYGFVLLWRAGGPQRRIAVAIGAGAGLYAIAVTALMDDSLAQNFGQRRFVDVSFVLCVGLGPALTALHGGIVGVLSRAAVACSIAAALLGTVAPFGGAPGEPGFVYAAREFAHLAHRAPVQAVLDVMLAALAIALALWWWPPRPAHDEAAIARA